MILSTQKEHAFIYLNTGTYLYTLMYVCIYEHIYII